MGMEAEGEAVEEVDITEEVNTEDTEGEAIAKAMEVIGIMATTVDIIGIMAMTTGITTIDTVDMEIGTVVTEKNVIIIIIEETIIMGMKVVDIAMEITTGLVDVKEDIMVMTTIKTAAIVIMGTGIRIIKKIRLIIADTMTIIMMATIEEDIMTIIDTMIDMEAESVMERITGNIMAGIAMVMILIDTVGDITEITTESMADEATNTIVNMASTVAMGEDTIGDRNITMEGTTTTKAIIVTSNIVDTAAIKFQ